MTMTWRSLIKLVVIDLLPRQNNKRKFTDTTYSSLGVQGLIHFNPKTYLQDKK